MRFGLLLGGLFIPAAASGQSYQPQFSNYPVAERYHGRQAAPKLVRGTAAWLFRTRIREAAQGKPNFAGHYIAATWGCGAECLSSAIIDVKTGTVYFNDVSTCCWFSAPAATPTEDFEPIRFRLNSRLIIFTGLLGEAGRNGAHYFRFEHGRLIAIR
ncbi:hypothetical protein [Hymenobacter terrenus]|uniref:hypothetical protein n=1 Tax=Hymenobacter terrenus TaxID=1629124 RepID=UPI00069735C0|nr:hypothetical protein [Hymenobacter terrenus]